MLEKLLTLLVGILLALAGWSLSRTFELSTIQAVHEDKVELMTNKDKEIMEQHKKLFEVLDSNQPTTGYNYN